MLASTARHVLRYFANEVEKPAVPRAGNPSPDIPRCSKAHAWKATVLVQFVVDTLGVVDMRTFTVLDSSNDLFGESRASTLAKWRFYPAEAGGTEGETDRAAAPAIRRATSINVSAVALARATPEE